MEIRTDTDPVFLAQKRAQPSWQRREARKKTAADGTPLCATCGQKHGNCKHTR